MLKFTWAQWQEMIVRPVRGMTRQELTEELAEHNRIKAWSSRYYDVQNEIYRRDNIDNNRRAVCGLKDYENQ